MKDADSAITQRVTCLLLQPCIDNQRSSTLPTCLLSCHSLPTRDGVSASASVDIHRESISGSGSSSSSSSRKHDELRRAGTRLGRHMTSNGGNIA